MTGGQREGDERAAKGKSSLRQARQGTGQKSKRQVWHDLTTSLDELDIKYKEKDDSYIIERGSTVVYLTVYNWGEDVPQVVVEVSGTVSAEYDKLSGEVALQLLTASAEEVPFGGFQIDTAEGSLYFVHNLMGDYLEAETLALVINEVGQSADSYDDDIAAETGGYREWDL